MKFQLQEKVNSTPAAPQRSQSAATKSSSLEQSSVSPQSEARPQKKVVRLRSLGTQTFINLNNYGSTDMGSTNPFYKGTEDDDDDEDAYDRRSALQLSTLSPVNG